MSSQVHTQLVRKHVTNIISCDEGFGFKWENHRKDGSSGYMTIQLCYSFDLKCTPDEHRLLYKIKLLMYHNNVQELYILSKYVDHDFHRIRYKIGNSKSAITAHFEIKPILHVKI